MIAWLPTFALRILDNCVNNNMETELLSFLAAIVQLNIFLKHAQEATVYTCMRMLSVHEWSCDMRFWSCSVERDQFWNAVEMSV